MGIDFDEEQVPDATTLCKFRKLLVENEIYGKLFSQVQEVLEEENKAVHGGTIVDATGGDLYITALVEDGMFEENVMYPVAIYSEMLWDANADIKEMVSQVALRSYVEFA